MISGFSKTGGTSLDLDGLGFTGAGEASFVENSKGTAGVLTVTSGGQTAYIRLLGGYAGASFTASDDGHGGTTIVATTGRSAAAQLVSAMAALAPAGGMSAISSAQAASAATALAIPLHT